jgi:hypothetical protein
MTRAYCQRDAKTQDLRSHGCGAYAALSALAWASDGDYQPVDHTAAAQYRVNQSSVSTAEFLARGMTPSELATSMHAVRATDERMDLPVQRMSGVHVRDELLPLIRDGAGALVAVRYGAVVDAGKGHGTYRGGHWVFVVDDNLDNAMGIADPLRRQWVTWPISVLVESMETFGKTPWGNGRGEAIVIWPWPTWRDGYGKVKGQRDALKVRVEKLEREADPTTLNNLRSKVKDVSGKLEVIVDELDVAVAPV